MTAPATGRSPAQLAMVVLALALVGALAGVVWEWIWDPTMGVVVDHQWSAGSTAGLRQEFSATGWYVVVATAAGLLAGTVLAMVADRAPLLTLVAVVLGSAIAAWLMLVVGSALGPPDPSRAAHTAQEGTRLPSELTVSGRSPFFALPAGALVGMAVVFIGAGHNPARPHDGPESAG